VKTEINEQTREATAQIGGRHMRLNIPTASVSHSAAQNRPAACELKDLTLDVDECFIDF